MIVHRDVFELCMLDLNRCCFNPIECGIFLPDPLAKLEVKKAKR